MWLTLANRWTVLSSVWRTLPSVLEGQHLSLPQCTVLCNPKGANTSCCSLVTGDLGWIPVGNIMVQYKAGFQMVKVCRSSSLNSIFFSEHSLRIRSFFCLTVKLLT